MIKPIALMILLMLFSSCGSAVQREPMKIGESGVFSRLKSSNGNLYWMSSDKLKFVDWDHDCIAEFDVPLSGQLSVGNVFLEDVGSGKRVLIAIIGVSTGVMAPRGGKSYLCAWGQSNGGSWSHVCLQDVPNGGVFISKSWMAELLAKGKINVSRVEMVLGDFGNISMGFLKGAVRGIEKKGILVSGLTEDVYLSEDKIVELKLRGSVIDFIKTDGGPLLIIAKKDRSIERILFGETVERHSFKVPVDLVDVRGYLGYGAWKARDGGVVMPNKELTKYKVVDVSESNDDILKVFRVDNEWLLLYRDGKGSLLLKKIEN